MSREGEQRQRLGFLGGSFDPVHLGHLMAAEDAIDGLALDKVIFVPTAQSPLKDAVPAISDTHRVELLRLAIARDPRFEISMVELNRGGVSYTINTVEALSSACPRARLFWIIGADRAASLSAWHRIDDLAARVEFIVMERPGFCWRGADLHSGFRIHPIGTHRCTISSSEIRERVREGLSLQKFVPEGVASLIRRLHLYS